MATLNFPSSPSNGEIHTHDGKQWQYVSADTKWIAYGASLAPDVLKVDAANNRVGINQTSPAYGLDVTGTARVTGVITASGGVVGNVTGNASGTALTVTQASQPSITTLANVTSVGTLTGLTMGGELAAVDQVISRPVMKDYGETKVAMAAHAVDLSLGNVQTYTLSGNQTLTFTNSPASGTAGSFTLIVTNGASATLTWPTSVDWAGGTAPTLTASGIDILTFTTIDGGTIWYGFLAGADMK